MPQQIDIWSQWFYTNAPAAWISALVATITCIYVLWTKKRPNRIIVRQVSAVSLLQIWRGVKDKIAVLFEGKAVSSLGLVNLSIFNSGSDVVKSLLLKLTCPDESTVLEAYINSVISETSSRVEDNIVLLQVPYLNPFREHKQTLDVILLVDGKIDPLLITGGGEGWSIKYDPLPTARQTSRSFNLSLVFFVALLGSLYINGRYNETYLGIPMAEISLRALLAMLPSTIAMLVGIFFLLRNFRYRLARLNVQFFL